MSPRTALAALLSVGLAACGGPDRVPDDAAADRGPTSFDVVRDVAPPPDAGDAAAPDAGDDAPTVLPDVGVDDALFTRPDGSADVPGTVLGACSTVLNIAQDIRETALAGPAPAPRGGAVLPGWYYLTVAHAYPASGPDPDAGAGVRRQSTLTVSGGNIYLVDRRGAAIPTSATFRVPTDSGSTTVLQLCPLGDAGPPVGYDADATSLTLHYEDPGGPRLDVYTRQ